MDMMMTFRKAIVVMVISAGCVLVAADGSAQTLAPPAQRPMQGLFGRAPKSEGLDVAVSTFEAYDGDEIGAGTGLVDPRMQKSGAFDGLDAAVTLQRKFRHVSFEGVERSAVRYYPSLQDLVGVKHSGAAGFTADFNRTEFRFTQAVAYAPYYSYSTLPQLFDAQPADVPVAPDQFLTRRPAFVIDSSGAFSQTLGRATLSLTASTQRTDFLHDAGNGLRADTATGRVVYHLTRDVGLVGGYGYQRGQYEISPAAIQTVEFHNIEAGIDYNHALSLTRRTTVGFVTGTTAVRNASGAPEYRVIGEARISREIGRTWHATASYHRGGSLVAGFGQPIFADSVALSVGGSISSRLTLSTSAGYSTGELTATKDQNRTSNYSGSARLQFALSRLMALSAEYDYYRYRFDRPVGLPDGIRQDLDRRSVLIGLSLWLPLLR
jgi:hypothetical protein